MKIYKRKKNKIMLIKPFEIKFRVEQNKPLILHINFG